MHKFALLLLIALALPLQAADQGGDTDKSGGTIYKTVGPDGKVIFTDKPPADGSGEKVHLGPTNVQPIALPRPLPTRKLSPKDKDEPQDLGPVNFAIVSPQNDATIPPGQRYIVLQVAIEPVPRDGYAFYVVVDGQRWAGTSSGTSLDISALERGSHSLQAVLLDLKGNVLAQSQTVTVHVKRPGGRIPDNPAPQAEQAPKAPVAPGVSDSPPRRRTP